MSGGQDVDHDTSCILCCMALGPGDRFTHRRCEDEKRRRMRLWLCVVCGEREARCSDSWCSACRAADSHTYCGYPGAV